MDGFSATEPPMIPMIGIMIGFYIITRMIELLARKGERTEPRIVAVFAVTTIVVAGYAIYSLATTGASLADSLP
jgi:hypothetical protein